MNNRWGVQEECCRCGGADDAWWQLIVITCFHYLMDLNQGQSRAGADFSPHQCNSRWSDWWLQASQLRLINQEDILLGWCWCRDGLSFGQDCQNVLAWRFNGQGVDAVHAHIIRVFSAMLFFSCLISVFESTVVTVYTPGTGPTVLTPPNTTELSNSFRWTESSLWNDLRVCVLSEQWRLFTLELLWLHMVTSSPSQTTSLLSKTTALSTDFR